MKTIKACLFCMYLFSAVSMSILFSACQSSSTKTVTLWTNQSDFAIYTEIYNTKQKKYKLETYYFENLTDTLAKAKKYPDIVVGTGLKNSETRRLFKSLDYFFDELLLKQTSFYINLLRLGNIDGKQYLLPVSFNLPAVIFSKDNSSLITKPFYLTLDEIQSIGKSFNQQTKEGVYTRMGFSPRWDDDFLFIVTRLFNVSYRESNPLAWDAVALERAMNYVYQWSITTNGSPDTEDDFAFKYLYNPPSVIITSGKSLFAYISSDNLFTLSKDRLNTLDFRWVGQGNSIPIIEGSPFLGIYKKSKAKDAIDAFIQWFYREENQREMLQLSKELQLLDHSFGIANGFSALKTVTEQIFPAFYPILLGHTPPADSLTPPGILPKNWETIKKRVILPYLHNASRSEKRSGQINLEKQLSEWLKNNPQ
ncbi:extracellular solute-binding protein [Gracilinema caldarium]|uniref:Lipoprotein n=1 Tax=Gracilinema caldarium (strain ATCC 51460 / DSM 7334 / H1) TaxID=744872 RepID=F8F3X6_GRAC1|nr:extracellular solute-binding protein [Gracilinema caldarium]AEJ20495.1 putative lipoprotein [Gracilinema caldarium DSM 7334]